MPANLDASTQKTIVLVSTFSSLSIAIPAVWAQLVTVPKLRRRLSDPNESGPSLLFGCLASVVLMAFLTALITWGIVSSDLEDQARKLQEQLLSSSINFCEEDFRHSIFIAEPANVVSSITCYVPLGLLGIWGPPSNEYRQFKRFIVIYATLLTIGLGSTALHALLTAEAQAGDELPMLWYMAALAFAAMNVILSSTDRFKSIAGSSWPAVAVLASAVIATGTYVMRREDFVVFHLMFSLYVVIMIFSILYITFGIDWETCRNGIHFQAMVLFPLALSAGWFAVLAVWVWDSEMLFCNLVMRERTLGHVLAPFLWNRCVHPLWHFLSGMLAWLLVQVLLAAHGMQQGWGTPSLRWFGAPYVVFQPNEESKKIQ